MEKVLQLNFNCPKKLEEITTSSHGLHCDQCAKPVLNLSNYAPADALSILDKYGDSLPCVAISSDAITNVSKSYYSYVSPAVRKSAFLITALLLVGNIKQLFAQVKTQVASNLKPSASKPIGFQKIEIKGSIKDVEGNGIAQANIKFSFKGVSLREILTDENGNFNCSFEYFGGIREIDISVSANNFEYKSIENVSLLKADNTLDVILKKSKPFEGILGGVGWTIMRVDYEFREQPDIFGRYSPQLLDAKVVYLNEKLVYQTRIVNQDGSAIANAKVQIKYPNNITREGFTDNNGDLNLFMQLDSQSLHANIHISADGYRSKKIIFYEFDKEGLIVHKLLKKHANSQEKEMDDVEIQEMPLSKVQEEGEPNEPKPETDNNILIYPNPANENFTIQLPYNKKTSIQLLDMNGRVVQQRSVYHQPKVLFDTKTFVPGNYVVVVDCDGKVFSEKIIISK